MFQGIIMPRSSLARLSLLLVATSALCPVAAMAADPITLTKTGPLTAAYGISADGQTVVGYYEGNGNHPKGIIWKSGEIPAEPLSNMDDNIFTGISGDGSAVIGYFDVAGVNSPFVYTIGTPTDLPVYATTGVGTIAQGINADGSVVVGTGPNGTGGQRGIVWSGPNWQTKTTIEPIDPAGKTDAYAVGGPLAHPIVVGEDIDHNNTFDAYWWQDGTTHDLDRTGYVGANGLGISRDGSTIVGDVVTSTTDSHAAIWSGTGYGLTDIGTLGGHIAYARAADADGRVVIGDSFTTGNAGIHVFRFADGHMDDLNDLISGVNPDNVVLDQAGGISDDGDYIAANASANGGAAYLVYYNDGHVGLTDGGDQQGSVDALGQERQAVAIAADPYFSLLQGDLDRHDQSNSAGAFGLFGSAVAGLRGHWWLGNGFTLTGGIADGTTEAGDANIGNALFGAAALRYDADDFAVAAFHPFVQVGLGEALLSGVDFTRDYGSGTGTGTTGGALSTVYLRAGLSADFDSGDQLAFAGELGESWLSINGYDEPFSNTNMFPASIAGGSDQSTVGKLSATWSHQVTDSVDLTLQAALAADLTGHSGLKVATTGFGTLDAAYVPAMWADGGAHLTWNVSPNSNIDLYADGTAGGPGGTHAHIGVGFHITN
jgi:probable HAF family extracellular repeat protein